MRNTPADIWAGIFLLMLFSSSQAGAQQPAAGSGPAIGSSNFCIFPCGQDPNGFLIRSYQGKSRCLDYTPGAANSPVVLNDCANSHVIVVEETHNAHHDVFLRAGTLVIGLPGDPIGGGPSTTAPAVSGAVATTASVTSLVLVDPNFSGANPSAGSVGMFALDGDSIVLDSDRTRVVQVQNSRGSDGAPVVLGPRALADSEFWDFVAFDGSGRDPTSDFMRVTTRQDLLNAITVVNQLAWNNGGAAWGSVIKIMDSAGTISLASEPGNQSFYCPPSYGPDVRKGKPVGYTCEGDGTVHHLLLPTGVTIHGSRRGVTSGPLLFGDYYCGVGLGCEQDVILQIIGDYVRITGLRLQGPTRCVDSPVAQGDPIGCQSSNHAIVHAIQIGWSPPQVMMNQATSSGSSLPAACAMPSTDMLCPEPTGVAVDHNEIFDWPEAVPIIGQHNFNYYPYPDPTKPPLTQPPPPQYCDVRSNPSLDARVHVDRNFVHHNENFPPNGGGAYGIIVLTGATLTTLGNTFWMNRHSIAADGDPGEQYVAWGNLVLSNVPMAAYSPQQDFDVHGITPSGHTGTFAGNEVDILWNTFLGGNRTNFYLRGAPCDQVQTASGAVQYAEPVDYFSFNVSMNPNPLDVAAYFPINPPDGIPVPYGGPAPALLVPGTLTEFRPYVTMSGNQHVSTNPADSGLGVGDFDGDGIDDLFLATGAAWYYSPGGKAEWRYLNSGKTDRIHSLLFGDFDGDGRTDVAAINPSGKLAVSWGGISDWEVLNTNSLPCTSISDMATGDFDGDGKADIFCADGGTWWISYAGNSPFVQVIVASSARVRDLRFGDFDGDGTTDVFGVVNGPLPAPHWMVRYAPRGVRGVLGGWQPLPVSWTNTVDSPLDSLVVADFDGDGRADVADLPGGFISFDAAGPWKHYELIAGPGCTRYPALAGIGHFAGNRGVDVLAWNASDNLCIAPGGNAAGQVGWTTGFSYYSLQDMR